MKKQILSRKMKVENSPHLVIPKKAQMDLIYSQSERDLKLFLETVSYKASEEYMKQPAEFWIHLLNSTLATPRVTVRKL